MALPKDEDIVVHHEGKFYILTKEQWQKTELEGSSAGPARTMIETGSTVGYIPPKPVAPGIGGFSTVLNLSAVLKGSDWRQ